MSLSIALADRRAAFKREMARLSARPIEGGPQCAVRMGVLLAWADGRHEVAVDDPVLEALRRLPDCSGPGAVEVLLHGQSNVSWESTPSERTARQVPPPLLVVSRPASRPAQRAAGHPSQPEAFQ